MEKALTKTENKVENKVRPQNKHLIPIKKGERLNPNGRPKGQRNYATIYREALIKIGKENNKTPEEIENMMTAKGLAEAMKGNYNFYKDVMDRAHGTAVQKNEFGGTDGEPMQFITFREFENGKKKKK